MADQGKKPVELVTEVRVGFDKEGAVHVLTTGKREDISLALLLALSSNRQLLDLVLLSLKNTFRIIGEINSDLWLKEKEQ